MARFSSNTSPWPMTITTAAHPHHVLLHLLFFRNFCNVCGRALAGKLGYRCEPCDFDIHCECLPGQHTMPQGPPPVQTPPRPYKYSHYPPPPACNHQHVPPRQFRPQLQLSLSGSGNFDLPQHHQQQQQQGGQSPPSPQRPQYYPAPQPPQSYAAPQSYPAPQTQQSYPAPQTQQSYDNGYDEPDGPVGYNHLQQQQDYYPTTNNYGEYPDNYSAAMEFGDTYAEDYYDSRDFGDEPDTPVSYDHLQQQQDYYPTANNNYGDYVDNYSAATDFGDAYADDYYDSMDYGDGDDY